MCLLDGVRAFFVFSVCFYFFLCMFFAFVCIHLGFFAFCFVFIWVLGGFFRVVFFFLAIKFAFFSLETRSSWVHFWETSASFPFLPWTHHEQQWQNSCYSLAWEEMSWRGGEIRTMTLFSICRKLLSPSLNWSAASASETEAVYLVFKNPHLIFETSLDDFEQYGVLSQCT